MNYSIEEVYQEFGKDDKVAVIDFVENSDAYNKYGKELTVVVDYTQEEREAIDETIELHPSTRSAGIVKLKELLNKIDDALKETLLNWKKR